MDYYVMRIKYQKDGTVKKSEVMDYDTMQKALAKFHTNIGTDMSDDTLAGSMCTVINGAGAQIETSFWGEIPLDEPQPEPEPVVEG